MCGMACLFSRLAGGWGGWGGGGGGRARQAGLERFRERGRVPYPCQGFTI